MLDYSSSAKLSNISSIFSSIGFHSDVEFFNTIPLQIYCFYCPTRTRPTIVLSSNRYGLKGRITLYSNDIFLEGTQQKMTIIDALYYLINNKYD
jgi:hypothetical protein